MREIWKSGNPLISHTLSSKPEGVKIAEKIKAGLRFSA
jgi:hypothetical protein